MDEPPMDEPPMDEPPMDELPMDEAPMDEPPMDELPMDELPMDELPMDEAPMDEPLMDEPPMDEPLMDEPLSCCSGPIRRKDRSLVGGGGSLHVSRGLRLTSDGWPGVWGLKCLSSPRLSKRRLSREQRLAALTPSPSDSITL
ncbi:hypothetical protein EYF80_062773 [Liparis tanakae]|uniref:Uncharacterized protein n=1 Tax=Liparis tanakae TaxID=230148 RepID=A0A4Z2EED4_9TELE|nr:hypothetical protein EYF80_062773 [Liparis tanakae]